MNLYIHGSAAISAAGDDATGLTALVSSAASPPSPESAAAVTDDPLPAGGGYALADFHIRSRLGRRGTSFYDRVTSLAVAACHDALADSGIVVDDANRSRIGVVLGTTLGSFKSTSDYTKETLTQDKPYLVNPMLFPNTVMNCATGQAAIRYGLKGINATTAGGPLAFFHAVSYARNAVRRGYADVVLAGAAEEFSAHRAWMTARRADSDEERSGEGAAVFVLSRSVPAEQAAAQICAVATGYGPQGTGEQALESCIRRVLDQAGVKADDVELLATAEVGAAAATWDLPGTESGPAYRVLGHQPRSLLVSRMIGDCGAATPALGLAMLMQASHSTQHSHGALGLLTARGTDGAAAALLMRGAGTCRS